MEYIFLAWFMVAATICAAHELRDWQGFLNVLTLKQGGPDEAVPAR